MLSHVSRGLGVWLLAGLVLTGAGCDDGRVRPPRIDAKKAGRLAIEMFDANKDGKLTGKELDKCPGLKAACTRSAMAPATVDPAGTGVTAEMITERIIAWQASRLGRMSLRCMVTLNNQPLEGADVHFVPEPFIKEASDKFDAASGRTDANGVAMLSIPIPLPPPGKRSAPPGVPPGLYRVEITKAGLKIPAKYNTETILGQEVAIDAAGIRNGIKFDLVF